MNFRRTRAPYGGANAFLWALRDALGRRGFIVTDNPRAKFDVALLNALSGGLDLRTVERLAECGRPIIHRKVGYRVSGSPEMRRVVDGVVEGDRRQVEFTPYVAHTVFQSAYSRDVFFACGFSGPHTIIHNGVDETVFNRSVRRRWPSRAVDRPYWDGVEPLRVIVSTWSTDENKGFEDYRQIDAAFAGRADVRLTLVGRIPEGTTLRTFEVIPPRRRDALAGILKQQHVLLQLARFETCSNALIEGLNCGLPAIYLDSGANAEVAARYGTEFCGDLDEALLRIRRAYGDIVERLPANPYRISLVVQQYADLLHAVTEAH